MSIPPALLERLVRLLEQAEQRLPPAILEPDWQQATAFRWRQGQPGYPGGRLQAVLHPHAIDLDDLCGIDAQRELLETNTRQFIDGHPANNALLWGSRGTGKSSLIKALLHRYSNAGLRLIEVEKQQLLDLDQIIDRIWDRPERFILFCDDLSFEADEGGYKALKAVLDGSITAPADNLLVYATSNRRHLLPEFQSDNQQTRHIDGEIHHGEAVEEKISLSERFGLWLSFHPFNQDAYLDIVYHWLDQLGASYRVEQLRPEALRWALAHGSRSGRSAWQFARDWAGRQALLR